MNWMIVFYVWLIGIPVCMITLWVMDQAHMANKRWGARSRPVDGAVGSIAWPIIIMLFAAGKVGDMWDSLWNTQYLFKNKQVKKCNRGMR